MVADMMSEPSQKEITISLTVRVLILRIIRNETFRTMVKYVEKGVLYVLYLNVERSIQRNKDGV